MPIQDAAHIKEKIISFLRTRGPSLPVHLAKETNQSILFASAFLAELLSEKTIKISDMKIGSSPAYFLPGQESQLEKYSQHLNSKEKDALILLKEKKFLRDKDQEPAIRVALRSIKDFAFPFKPSNSEEIFWRYITTSESEFTTPPIEPPKEVVQEIKQEIEQEPSEKIIIKPPILVASENIKERELDIFNKPYSKEELQENPQEESKTKLKTKSKPKKVQKNTSSVNEKFFNKVKEFLSKKQIEIIGIEGFSKNELFLRAKTKKQEQLLIAYNKKRITDSDIITAHKKASETNLPYTILSLGEPLKKIKDLIEALKNLESIEKIE